MNHLAIRYEVPIGFDATPLIREPLANKLEWCDVFAEREAWKALAKDAVALLLHSDNLNQKERTHTELLVKRLEKLL